MFQASPLRPLVPGAIENMAGLSQIRLEVWPQRTVVTNLKVRLRKTHQPAGNTLRVARSTGLVYPDSQIWTFAWPTNTPATLYVSPQYARPLATNDWPVYFDLEAQIVDLATNVVFSDTIRLTVAPMILPPECNPPQAIYSTCIDWIPGITEVNCDTETERWAQDMVKFVKYQKRTNQVEDIFVDLNHHLKYDFPSNLVSQQACTGGNFIWPVYMGGNGGNIMATPPLPDAPYGKLMIGSTLPTHVNQKAYWAGQGIQPVVDITTDWLLVGHVDEVLMWAATNKVLYADPWKAADLLHGEIVSGGWTNTLWWGKYRGEQGGKAYTVRSVVIDNDGAGFKITTLPSALDDSTNSVTIDFTNAIFAVNDYLRVDDEILKVTSINGTSVTVSRAQAGRSAAAHTKGSAVYAYSAVMVENLVTGMKEDSVVKLIAAATNELAIALGSYVSQVQFIPMPVLFMYTQSNGRWGYVAGTANVVNGLIAQNDTYYYSHTGNSTLLNYVSTVVDNARACDLWDLLHCGMGEIHCATAARRELDLTTPWWQAITTWE